MENMLDSIQNSFLWSKRPIIFYEQPFSLKIVKEHPPSLKFSKNKAFLNDSGLSWK